MRPIVGIGPRICIPTRATRVCIGTSVAALFFIRLSACVTATPLVLARPVPIVTGGINLPSHPRADGTESDPPLTAR